MLTRARTPGFTLVELLVAVAVLAIILAVAMPSFSGMMRNSRIGSAASSYLVGLQTARTEAIRRNTPVDFLLTDMPVSTSLIESAATPSAVGKNWVVRVPEPLPPAAAASAILVESKSAQEGGGAALDVLGVTTAPASASFNGTVTFNGFGATSTGETVVLDVSNPAGGACAVLGGPMRCQRILVRPGGQIVLCDPAAAAGDSRACPA